ncbi:MAG: polysaccharide deacetylase family protein [Hyphomicrobiaceae bacterium]
MSRRKANLAKLALSTLHYTGAGGLLSPLTRGVGVIFMLHRVRPAPQEELGPNRILEIEPQFLEDTITLVRNHGFDIVSLDEVHARLREGDFDRPFAAFTFDDGYRDNRDFAYPIMKRHEAPFTVYIPTDFPDGKGDLWWLTLEGTLAGIPSLDINIDGTVEHFDLSTHDLKEQAFDRVYWWLRAMPEKEARQIVSELAMAHGGYDPELCRKLIMDWDELREFAAEPLVTLGAHTRRHMSLGRLSHGEAALEMAESISRLEAEISSPVKHFSYPYGDVASAGPREFTLARELGMKTAVTTRKGLLHARHTDELTALPRVSLNGDYQNLRYVKVLLSGAPFAFLNVARRLQSNVAA